MDRRDHRERQERCEDEGEEDGTTAAGRSQAHERPHSREGAGLCVDAGGAAQA
jgi:hypothetical protein